MARRPVLRGMADWKYPERGACGVYGIWNVHKRGWYIGSSKDISVRWRCHLKRLRRGTHGNRKLQAAWNKYGEHCFRFVVCERVPVEELVEAEQWYIDWTGSYNIRPRAESNRGHKLSDETRAKLSIARLGNKNALGTKQSAETIAKRIASIKARFAVTPRKPSPPISDEHRRKMSESLKGRPNKMRGCQRSDEFKAKVASGMRRYWNEKRGGFSAKE